METRLNPETTAISNDYTKKLRDELDSNNKRINDLSVFIESLRGYEKETRLLQDRNTGLRMVINSINDHIMRPIDEVALNSSPLTIDLAKIRTSQGGLGSWSVNIKDTGLVGGVEPPLYLGALRPK